METNYIGLISLALILWAVYELGKSNGAHAATARMQKAVGFLFAAKQAAEEEAAQCKFACALFDEALKAQAAKIGLMEKDAVDALKVAEAFIDRHSEDWYMSGQRDLETVRKAIALFDNKAGDNHGTARIARGPTVSESEREMLVRPGPVILLQGGGKS